MKQLSVHPDCLKNSLTVLCFYPKNFISSSFIVLLAKGGAVYLTPYGSSFFVCIWTSTLAENGKNSSDQIRVCYSSRSNIFCWPKIMHHSLAYRRTTVYVESLNRVFVALNHRFSKHEYDSDSISWKIYYHCECTG